MLASRQLDPSIEAPPPKELKAALADASPAAKAQVLNQARSTEKPSVPSVPTVPERARVVIEAIDSLPEQE
jgi:hypothetical protein